MIAKTTLLAATLLLSLFSHAQLKLPALVSDSMVLQRDQPVKIWGWSLRQTPVTLSFQDKTYHAVPDARSRWELTLPAMPAGSSYMMEITTAGDKKIIKGIAIGDVWLCSGQSNMAFNMTWGSAMFPNDIAESTNPDIREFHVGQDFSFSPKADVQGRWAPASPSNTGAFTAAGYYMVKALYDQYKVPMGILHTSWGGSSAEAWVSTEGLKDFNNYLSILGGFTDSTKLQAISGREKQLTDSWYKKVDDNDRGWHWSDTSFNASGWNTLQLPGYWENQGAGNVDGAVWVRKEITLDNSMTAKDALLELGIIDDVDVTFFNGKKIGGKYNKYQLRNYKVPSALMKNGKNVITIRILDTDGTGGFIPGKKYRLITASGDIDLSGTWQYAVGYSTDPLPVNSFVKFNQQPTSLFNAMIAPLIPYTIRGVAWYQGETNVGRGEEYKRLLPSMIGDWRKRWQQGDFPFLIVQLANYKPVKPEPGESMWADLRDAQLDITQKVPQTGLAVAIDIGEAGDVHPLDKKTVGIRLALAARKVAYGEKDIMYSGPQFQSLQIADDRAVLSFTHTGAGLIAKGGELRQFAIAGKDGKFHWANAKIQGSQVIVWSSEVKQPVAVRYAWADNPEGANLYNKEGLPASPFKTDRPQETSLRQPHPQQTTLLLPKERKVVQVTVPPAKFHLYLLAGQSNMAGRGFPEPADTIGNPHILRLNRDGEWEIAKDPVHFDKDVAGVGPGLTFAREMLKQDSTITIGLIPCAAGGSSIDNWLDDTFWEQTRSYPWNNAILRARLAMRSGSLKGILWHQGEADAGPNEVGAYARKLVSLVKKFRSSLHQADLPFLAGELPPFNKASGSFNPVLYEAKKQIPFFDVVAAEGFTCNPDGVHIDAASERQFGARYAAKMKFMRNP